MTQHSKYFSPSASHIWLRCAAAPKMQEGIEETTNERAEYGTYLHELADECYMLDCNPMDIEGVKQEDADIVQVYLDYIRNVENDFALSELKVDFTHLAPNGFGTSDFIAIKGTMLIVVDFKTGVAERIEAEGNSQAMLYALGALNDLSFLYNIEKIKLVIVQPTRDQIDEEIISLNDLINFQNDAAFQVDKILSDDPSFNPGEKQCKYCKAKKICKPLRDFIYRLIFEGDFMKKEIHTMTKEEYEEALSHAKLISKWSADLQDDAKAKLLNGEKIEGFKVVHGKGRRTWTDEEKAVEFLTKQLEEEDIYKKQIISPAQAEKKVSNKKLLQDYITKIPGALTMAPESDRRKAVDVDPASGFDEL